MDTPSPNDRRQSTERRASSDRRRGADERHVALEVDASTLRLAVTVHNAAGAEPLLLSHDIRWRNEAASLLTPAGASDLAVAIKQLVVEERLSGCETLLLLTPPLCVTRTATGSSSTIDRQVKELEERGAFYLSLGSGPVAMANRRYALDARHEHALLSVANQKIVEAAADACHEAGLQLKRIESSIVSLCRTHAALHPEDEAPVLLVSFGEKALVLGVAQQGRLLMEYLPGGAATPEDVPAIIEKHLKRMQRFSARKHMGHAKEIERLYLCGPTEQTQAAQKAFASAAPLPICTLGVQGCEGLWDTRSESVSPSMASVIGGAALRLRDEQSLEGPNLLEKWIRESRKHLRPILLRSAAPLVAVLLLALTLFGVNGSLAMSNGQLAQQVADGEPVRARHNNLRLELLSSDLKLKSLAQLNDGLPQNDLLGVVQRLGHCLPHDVWVERFTISDNHESTIYGVGYTEGGVYEFVSNLEAAPGANNVALQETGVKQTGSGPVTGFNLTAEFGKPTEPQAGKGANDE